MAKVLVVRTNLTCERVASNRRFGLYMTNASGRFQDCSTCESILRAPNLNRIGTTAGEPLAASRVQITILRYCDLPL